VSAVVEPLAVAQAGDAVRILLPSDWDGPSGVVVEIRGTPAKQALLVAVLTAIREGGDQEAIDIAQMFCRAMLGGAS
jgi:hypothetical protein